MLSVKAWTARETGDGRGAAELLAAGEVMEALQGAYDALWLCVKRLLRLTDVVACCMAASESALDVGSWGSSSIHHGCGMLITHIALGILLVDAVITRLTAESKSRVVSRFGELKEPPASVTSTVRAMSLTVFRLGENVHLLSVG